MALNSLPSLKAFLPAFQSPPKMFKLRLPEDALVTVAERE
jgi:hypothetical protein